MSFRPQRFCCLLRLALPGALAIVILAGCSMPHLAGTNDAVLEYAIQPDPATGTTLEAPLTAAGVKARISSAMVPSDVDATPEGLVRVVVDADIAGAVDDLVQWRGGLRVSRADDAFVLAPPNTDGLAPMSAGGPGGKGGDLQPHKTNSLGSGFIVDTS